MMADQYIVLINKRDHLCTLIDIAVPCEFHVVEEQKEKVAGEMWGVSFWDKADASSAYPHIANSKWGSGDQK